MAQYYEELDKGITNRAEEFKRNVSINEIIEKTNLADGKGKTTVSNHPGTRVFQASKKYEDLNPTAKKFIDNLKNNNNEWVE